MFNSGIANGKIWVIFPGHFDWTVSCSQLIFWAGDFIVRNWEFETNFQMEILPVPDDAQHFSRRLWMREFLMLAGTVLLIRNINSGHEFEYIMMFFFLKVCFWCFFYPYESRYYQFLTCLIINIFSRINVDPHP